MSLATAYLRIGTAPTALMRLSSRIDANLPAPSARAHAFHQPALCHPSNVISQRRDIKCSNILLHADHTLKLADFGLARGVEPPSSSARGAMTTKVITLWYRPPELLLGQKQYGAAVDMWSVGCIAAELWIKRPLFQAANEADQLRNMLKVLGTPAPGSFLANLPDFRSAKDAGVVPTNQAPQLVHHLQRLGLPPDLRKFTARLLDSDPTRRPTAADALRDPYFTRSAPVVDPDRPTAGLRPLSALLDARLDFHEYSSRQRRKAAAAAKGKQQQAGGATGASASTATATTATASTAAAAAGRASAPAPSAQKGERSGSGPAPAPATGPESIGSSRSGYGGVGHAARGPASAER